MQTIPTTEPSDSHAAASRRRWVPILLGIVLVLAIGSRALLAAYHAMLRATEP